MLRKFILFGIIAGISFLPAISQQKVQIGEFNPDYIEYLNLQKTNPQNDGNKGYIPIPIQLNFNGSTKTSSNHLKSGLPSYYNLKDYNLTTSVKNQSPEFGDTTLYDTLLVVNDTIIESDTLKAGDIYVDSTNIEPEDYDLNGGNCWTFTTTGALESNWLKKGYGSYDLSEQHMAACHGFEWGYGEGGNDLISLAYLTRLSGPILDSQNRYDTRNPFIGCVEGLKPCFYVTDARWLPNEKDVIKQAIYEHGALSISMYMEGASYDTNDFTYYYSGITPVNHALLLVGWDDEKETAAGTGAWICKNQWGTDWGDEGYFYISYFDTRVNTTAAYFPTRIDTSDIDTIYMYDELGPVTTLGMNSNTCYGLVKFEANSTQFINRVGTFINTEGTVIDIEIFDDFDGQVLSNKLNESKNLAVTYPGFYTFDIQALVNDDFYVKIKYTTPDYLLPISAELKQDTEGEPYSRPFIEKGVSWISRSGNFWTKIGSDVYGFEADICIRAYGMKKSPIASFLKDKEYVCLDGGTVTFTDASYGAIDSIEWNFGDGATPTTVIDTSKGSQIVTYSTSGKKDIMLIAFSGSNSDTIVKEKLISVSDSIIVTIPETEMLSVITDTFEFIAVGADNYTWQPLIGIISTEENKARGNFASEISKWYYVTGTQGTCSARDSILLHVHENPSNDFVCNAQLIKNGKNGPYTNKWATLQDNEPSPPEDGCVAPNSWCVEGGLHNSVWFKFSAPSTGEVSIEAYGFDTQIAVYDADSCEAILLDGYTLLAANDDIGFITRDSKIDLLSNLVPDKTYWLLVDGSQGGDTGTFYIDLTMNPNSIEFNTTESEISVYPNPADDIITITTKTSFSGDYSIQLISMSGKCLLQTSGTNTIGENTTTLPVGSIDPGIYLLQIKQNNWVSNKRIIIQ